MIVERGVSRQVEHITSFYNRNKRGSSIEQTTRTFKFSISPLPGSSLRVLESDFFLAKASSFSVSFLIRINSSSFALRSCFLQASTCSRSCNNRDNYNEKLRSQKRWPMRKWTLPREIVSALGQFAPPARDFPSLDDKPSRLKRRYISSTQHSLSRGRTDEMMKLTQSAFR